MHFLLHVEDAAAVEVDINHIQIFATPNADAAAADSAAASQWCQNIVEITDKMMP